jgi:hypothetical protein
VLALGAAPSLHPQDLHTITTTRQHRGEEHLSLRVGFAAGTLRLAPAAGDVLYRVRMTYDAERFEPVNAYDISSGQAQLGVRGREGADWNRRNAAPGQELELYVGPNVPATLELIVGAGSAEIDLGGLALTHVTVAAGATETDLRWASPNRAECSELVLKVGATKFTASGLGNAGCHRIDVLGGAGELDLDFAGEWTRDATVELRVALASLELRFPSDVGIAIEGRRLLAPLEQPGFAKKDGVLYSGNWDAARVRVRVVAHAALGGLTVGWIDEPATR